MIIFGILSVLAVACLIYYFIMCIYAGFSTAFSLFWIASAILLAIAAFLYRYVHVHEVRIPSLLRILIRVVIIAGFILFIGVEAMIMSGAFGKTRDNMDYIIVLGAQVKGTRPSGSLAKRLDKAVDYLNDNEKTIAIVSGGQGIGEDISEAQCMRDYLIDKGIDKSRILMEDKSTTTEENIKFSMKLVEPGSSVGVVTNNFHIYRTLSVCKAQGFTDVSGIPAPSDRILFVNYSIREFFAVVKYKAAGAI